MVSLEQQDIPKSEYEIIVTNDGSPDQSAAVVTRLQAVYPNIQLINQENQGVSMARNKALESAQGKYVMPIDPDDYVLPHKLKRILEKAESEDLDVLYLGFEIFDAQGKSIWKTQYDAQAQQTYSGIEGYFAARGPEVRDPDRSWGILYRRSLLEQYQVHYPKDVPFLEDGQFLIKVFSVAQKVGFDAEIFHQRTTSEGSATVSGVYQSPKAIEGFLKAAVDLKEFAVRLQLGQDQLGLIHHGIAKYVQLSMFPNIAPTRVHLLVQTIRRIKQLHLCPIPTQGVRQPYLRYARYFNVSPYLMALLFAWEGFAKKIKNNTDKR